MSNITISSIHHHNQAQLDYFGQEIKKTMIPVKTTYVYKHINAMHKFAELKRADKILEVGCGMGKFTLPLKEKGLNVTGLDLSGFLLQKLLEYNDNRFDVPLICSDILEIPEEYNQRFDKVIGFFTLHHFHHLETYFQAMKRVLKPGGAIYFIEPNAWNPLYYFQILFTPGMTWKGDKGVAKMHKTNFKNAASYADLKFHKSINYGFFPPFIVNNKIGRRIDDFLEKQAVLNPILPFQLLKFTS